MTYVRQQNYRFASIRVNPELGNMALLRTVILLLCTGASVAFSPLSATVSRAAVRAHANQLPDSQVLEKTIMHANSRPALKLS